MPKRKHQVQQSSLFSLPEDVIRSILVFYGCAVANPQDRKKWGKLALVHRLLSPKHWVKDLCFEKQQRKHRFRLPIGFEQWHALRSMHVSLSNHVVLHLLLPPNVEDLFLKDFHGSLKLVSSRCPHPLQHAEFQEMQGPQHPLTVTQFSQIRAVKLAKCDHLVELDFSEFPILDVVHIFLCRALERVQMKERAEELTLHSCAYVQVLITPMLFHLTLIGCSNLEVLDESDAASLECRLWGYTVAGMSIIARADLLNLFLEFPFDDSSFLDLHALGDCMWLTNLTLAGPGEDYTFLPQIRNLEYLCIRNNDCIIELPCLTQLKSLKTVELECLPALRQRPTCGSRVKFIDTWMSAKLFYWD